MDIQRRFFNMLMASQYWADEQMRAYQRRELSGLVCHARNQTRYYRNRLAPLFRADGSIDWDKWTALPIVKRADIMGDPEAFYAATLPAGHGPTGEIQTSGSTGRRMTVRHTHLTALLTQALK